MNKERETWTGDCEWCGEKDVTLVCDDDLPEWTEGVACLKCAASFVEEKEARQNADYQQKMDRAIDAFLDLDLERGE